MSDTSLHSWAIGLATKNLAGEIIEVFYPQPQLQPSAEMASILVDTCNIDRESNGFLEVTDQLQAQLIKALNTNGAELGRSGEIVTFTSDHLVPTPEPPTIMASVDLDGGGRYYAEVVDAAPDAIHTGGRVELTFRRLHSGGGFPNYGWKLAQERSASALGGEAERMLEGA